MRRTTYNRLTNGHAAHMRARARVAPRQCVACARSLRMTIAWGGCARTHATRRTRMRNQRNQRHAPGRQACRVRVCGEGRRGGAACRLAAHERGSRRSAAYTFTHTHTHTHASSSAPYCAFVMPRSCLSDGAANATFARSRSVRVQCLVAHAWSFQTGTAF